MRCSDVVGNIWQQKMFVIFFQRRPRLEIWQDGVLIVETAVKMALM